LLVINRSYSLGVNVEICPYVSNVVELNIQTAYCELFSAFKPTITLLTIMSLATVSMQNKSPSVPNGRHTYQHTWKGKQFMSFQTLQENPSAGFQTHHARYRARKL